MAWYRLDHPDLGDDWDLRVNVDTPDEAIAEFDALLRTALAPQPGRPIRPADVTECDDRAALPSSLELVARAAWYGDESGTWPKAPLVVAVVKITEILRSEDWSVSYLEDIAAALTAAGIDLDQPSPNGDWPKH